MVGFPVRIHIAKLPRLIAVDNRRHFQTARVGQIYMYILNWQFWEAVFQATLIYQEPFLWELESASRKRNMQQWNISEGVKFVGDMSISGVALLAIPKPSRYIRSIAFCSFTPASIASNIHQHDDSWSAAVFHLCRCGLCPAGPGPEPLWVHQPALPRLFQTKLHPPKGHDDGRPEHFRTANMWGDRPFPGHPCRGLQSGRMLMGDAHTSVQSQVSEKTDV